MGMQKAHQPDKLAAVLHRGQNIGRASDFPGRMVLERFVEQNCAGIRRLQFGDESLHQENLLEANTRPAAARPVRFGRWVFVTVIVYGM